MSELLADSLLGLMTDGDCPRCCRAATEIHELREAVDLLEALRAETMADNARLRKALESIKGISQPDSEEYCEDGRSDLIGKLEEVECVAGDQLRRD